MPDRRALPLGRLALAAAAVALVVFIVLLGVLNPPRKDGVSTDRLGPEQGEQVADYLARARASLAGTDTADHWALVSFTEPLVPEQIPRNSGGMRISQVLYQVSIPRVQTPLVAVPVPRGDEAAVSSAEAAAWLLPRTVADQRAADINALSAARLRSGCACTVGLVLRGPLDSLRNLAAQNGIRAVQALPSDAVADRFGVVPLLPGQVDVVQPGPDDGPVPDR
ncbi:hypothetical protein NONI108955_22260 [Nocardia ninae]|uniref:Uncharacterized protein n=1 Tax=Nocardia ninae NBRC 108245 TaxID=1210091 RepID=A0A511MNN0_9NOCA|nr:hypothetical protein [Nocardia ninae]GEM41737.1 hypothetical protein NN4_62560 [Nocardia ninae NBRC 108245]